MNAKEEDSVGQPENHLLNYLDKVGNIPEYESYSL